MIDLGRGIGRYAAGRAREQRPLAPFVGRELRGSTLGVIGLGRIGAHLADLALAFGMRVLAATPQADRRPRRAHPPGRADRAARRRPISSSASRRRSADTDKLMNAAAFAAMRRGAFFVNASRGELVDDAALLAALDRGHLAGAALDVGRAPDQMPAPELVDHPRVIATPHIGGLTQPAIEHQALETVAQLARLLEGRDAGRRRQCRPCRSLAALARPAARRKTRMTIARSPWPGACDSHMHVYEDAYPLARDGDVQAAACAGRRRTAPCSASSASRARSSSSRPATASTTAARSAALAMLGPQARAVRRRCRPDVAPPSSSRCTTLGARGVRYMMLPGGVLPWSGLERTAATIAPLGWHIDLQLDGRELPLHEAMLARLPCRLVIDHVGRFMGPVEPDGDAVRALCRLLDARQLLDQDLGAVRKLAQPAAGLRRHRLDRAPGRAPLSRAVPVGEQLAASEPEPGAVERGDARLGPRLLRRSGGAAEGARRQPGRAVRLRAGRRHVNFAQPSAFAWTIPETSSPSPRRAAPASRAWSRRCSSSTRTSRCRSRTRRRKPRGQDQHGREYHFVDEPTFRAMIERGEFVEWAEVHGHLYGTSRGGDRGRGSPAATTSLLEIDWQGALQIKRLFPNAVLIFILPPSWDELRLRLRAARRGRRRT